MRPSVALLFLLQHQKETKIQKEQQRFDDLTTATWIAMGQLGLTTKAILSAAWSPVGQMENLAFHSQSWLGHWLHSSRVPIRTFLLFLSLLMVLWSWPLKNTWTIDTFIQNIVVVPRNNQQGEGKICWQEGKEKECQLVEIFLKWPLSHSNLELT